MLFDYLDGLTTIRGFKHDGLALQSFQDGMRRLTNQCVIVDNKNFHPSRCFIARR